MLAVRYDATGRHEIEAPAELVANHLRLVEQEKEASDARSRLERLKAQSGPRIEARDICGEAWHIKRLAWGDMVKAGTLQATGTPFEAVVLHIGVATGPEDDAPYFSIEDALEYVKLPAAAKLVIDLTEAISDLNPALFPKAPEASPKSGTT